MVTVLDGQVFACPGARRQPDACMLVVGQRGSVTVSAKVAAAPRGGRSTRCGGELSLYTSATGGRRYEFGTATSFQYPPILSRTRATPLPRRIVAGCAPARYDTFAHVRGT